MKNMDYLKFLSGCLDIAIALSLAGLAVKLYKICKIDSECSILAAKAKGFMKGYLSGDKEFAKQLKEDDIELYEEIMGY